MTPKEKAEEMVCSFEDFSCYPVDCALIAVDEILNTDIFSITQLYWEEVKQEIERL